MITYEIDLDKCPTGCGRCRRKCPEGAILGAKKECHVIDEDVTVRCSICLENVNSAPLLAIAEGESCCQKNCSRIFSLSPCISWWEY